jgi:hypothetical protein
MDKALKGKAYIENVGDSSGEFLRRRKEVNGGAGEHEIRRANAVFKLFLVEVDRTGKSGQSRSLERCWLKNQSRRLF